jgi:hypothetical protein
MSKPMLIELTKKHRTTALLLIVLLGLFLRLRGLDSTGFNDDEINKVDAAHSYLQGNFLVNLEHPMLMKSLITLSLVATNSWNHSLGRSYPIPDEVAVRLPNVIFGSLTAVVVFLMAEELFGVEVGLISAFLWAVGTTAITVNRLAKEDTLLVFFTWLAYYFYLRAKKLGATPSRERGGAYAASGASFGLMLASKYFPHYLGLNFLYYHLFQNKDQFPARRRVDTLLLFGACAVTFLLADPVVLHPATLKHMFHYVQQESITHHGYLMMGRFYTEGLAFQGGMPVYFYTLFLAIKTPFPVLVALAVGLVEVWRRRREVGPSFLIFMFLFWIVPFSLISSKWFRYMLSWMPTVTIIAAIGTVRIATWLSALLKPRMTRQQVLALGAGLAGVFLVVPLWTALKAAPFYSMYLNPLGMGRAGYYSPHEEFNDAGLREAIQKVCAEAPRGATVGGETPPVFTYYLHKFGREDLHYFQLSDPDGRAQAPRSAYLVVQDGRKYLENIDFIQEFEASDLPAHVVNIGGACAAKVYHAQELAQLRELR